MPWDVTGFTDGCYIIRCFTFQVDKKKKKKERVKLVVLNINEQGHVVEVSPVPVSHLEEIQPKGDQQLKQKRAVSPAVSIVCIDTGSQTQVVCGRMRCYVAALYCEQYMGIIVVIRIKHTFHNRSYF
jgi:hypothetical protein